MIALCMFTAGCATGMTVRERAAEVKKIGISASSIRGPVGEALREIGQAAGLDPAEIYVVEMAAKGPDGKPIRVPTINAESVGLGTFRVTKGLMQVGAENPCIAWGILAHEIGHEALRHQLKQETASGVLGMIPVPILALPIKMAADYLIIRAYSRAQERDADAKAVELLEKSGKPGWTVRYALEFMQEAYGDSGGGWLATHPLTRDRISALPGVDEERAKEICAGPGDRDRQIAEQRLAATEFARARKKGQKSDEPVEATKSQFESTPSTLAPAPERPRSVSPKGGSKENVPLCPWGEYWNSVSRQCTKVGQ